MSFRFIVGRSNKDHSLYILDEMTNLLRKEPFGKEVLLLVPDQMTFQHEYALFQEDRIIGSMRAQVSSFSRLAWRVIQETKGKTRKHITSNGIQMALRKIIEQKEDDWEVFSKVIEKQGFLEQLEGMITEFKRHNVTPEDLQNQIEQINQFVHRSMQEEALTHKLKDLMYIYEHLNAILQDTYLDGEDQLDLLIEAIETTNLFDESIVFIDGFYRFTPKEMLVVEALLKKGARMEMTLIVDPKEIKEEIVLSELDLFYQTKETYIHIKEMVESNGITFHQPLILGDDYEKNYEDDSLKHLEENFINRPAPSFKGNPQINIFEAVHPRAEVEGIAQKILQLVREEKARFRDIVIFIRDGDLYNDTIQTIFNDYHIPVFIDEKKPMLHHSLIEFIRSLLEMVETDWRYEPLFRLLKTGFIQPNDDENPLDCNGIDLLENYVLQYGIRHKSNWIMEEDWSLQKFVDFKEKVKTDEDLQHEKKINAYRNQVRHSLQEVDEKLLNAKTVKEYCETIYLFLEQLNVPNQLEQLQEKFLNDGEIEKAQEQEQVWDALIQLIDEVVEIAGEEQIDLTTFRKVLDAGFESLEFSHVPPAIDQVIVATVDQSRIGKMEYAFLLGVNEGLWPLKPASDRVMTEEERDLLKNYGLSLADTSSRQLLDDLFYMYLGFTTATKNIFVSYAISDGEGRKKIPSQMISRLYELFPKLDKPYLLQDPDDLQNVRRFITTPLKTRSTLATQLTRFQRGYPIDSIWWDVYNWYVENEKKYSPTYNVLQSLNYVNQPKTLASETVEALYSKQLNTSVSRLEMYNRCAYQHFLHYGLNLQERKRYKLDAPDIGQLFHESLRQITEWVLKEHGGFKKLTKLDAKNYANRAIQKYSSVLNNKILESSHRYQYIKHKLEKVIAQATFILSEQAKYSNFTPVGLEMNFGFNEKLNPLRIPLENGFELILRGQIDRIDAFEDGEDLYLRIIDYKSSRHQLSLLDVYYGLSLQVLLYLEVVLQDSLQWLGKKAKPAGVFYFHVHDALLNKDEPMKDTKLANELFKEYKLDGLVPNDLQAIKNMDTSLDSGWSDILPLALTKGGAPYKNAQQVISIADFSRIQNYIKNLIKDAGIEIIEGNIRLNPYEIEKYKACTYCPYRSVCQFDPILETNQYRKLPHNVNNEAVLKKLLDELGENKNEMD